MDDQSSNSPPPRGPKPRPAFLFRQSGVIPFLLEGGSLRVVLVTSNRSKRWIVPKGVVDRGRTPLESALNEAFEEAGVLGEAETASLGDYRYEKWGGTCVVEVFAMRVTNLLLDWPERAWRQRILVPMEEALTLVTPPEVVPLMAAGARLLEAKG